MFQSRIAPFKFIFAQFLEIYFRSFVRCVVILVFLIVMKCSAAACFNDRQTMILKVFLLLFLNRDSVSIRGSARLQSVTLRNVFPLFSSLSVCLQVQHLLSPSLNLYLCLTQFLSLSLQYESIYPSIYSSTYQYLSLSLSLSLSIYLPTYLPTYLSIFLPFCGPSICLSFLCRYPLSLSFCSSVYCISHTWTHLRKRGRQNSSNFNCPKNCSKSFSVLRC